MSDKVILYVVTGQTIPEDINLESVKINYVEKILTFRDYNPKECVLLPSGKVASVTKTRFREANVPVRVFKKDFVNNNNKKICSHCKNWKGLNHFVSGKGIRDPEKLTACCQSCRDAVIKSKNNPETKRGAMKAYYEQRKRELINERGCAHTDCPCNRYDGELPLEYFDFDHIHDKLKDVSQFLWFCLKTNMTANGFDCPFKFLDAEIAKCKLLCKAHHHKVTADRRPPRKTKLQGGAIASNEALYANQGNCSNPDCLGLCEYDENYLGIFHHDHIEQHKDNILVSHISSYNKAVEELNKTRILCVFCHFSHNKVQIAANVLAGQKRAREE